MRRRFEPAPPPLRSVDEPDDDLTLLQEKIAALEDRVAALEAGEPPPSVHGRPVRSA